ncbi:lipid-A-disaccharide synthase-related protein [Halomicronema hongdechloris]
MRAKGLVPYRYGRCHWWERARPMARLRSPILGPTQSLPSGGFIYMDGRQLARDLRGGLASLAWRQLQALWQWRSHGDYVLAIGDVVPLAAAWGSGLSYGFVGTAKSEYFLRDERGPLPQRPWFEGWSGSVYLPWERWLMGHTRCRIACVRDQLTAQWLRRWAIPAVYAGNPMMDNLHPHAATLTRLTTHWPDHPDALTLVLLPGSRAPEAMENWRQMVRAVAVILQHFPGRSLRFLGAIAPDLPLEPLQQALTAAHWSPVTDQPYPTYTQGQGWLRLSQDAYAACLHLADVGIAMAGTATEQCAGLGKPVITFPGNGPQFTRSFADTQARLLGPSILYVEHPDAVAPALATLLQHPERLQDIRANGLRRMGTAGAAQHIATLSCTST